jgi:hypothetical protein
MSSGKGSRDLRSRLSTRIDDAWAAALLLALALACALVLLFIPRPVAPNQLPVLRLPADGIRQVLAGERAAMEAGGLNQQMRLLEKLLLEKGRSDRNPRQSPQIKAQRLAELRRVFEHVQLKQGDIAVRALRARAVAKLESALRLELPDQETAAVLGSFPAILERAGAARDGELIAPPFVVRTMYKCRWNMIHGFDPTADLRRVELLAYWGWLALHDHRAPMARRLKALEQYGSLDGAGAAEAAGVLHYARGDFAQSARFLQTAYQQHPSLRLRNHLLAVQRTGVD